MYVEKRPTCVTVIGWAWIIIGVLMSLSGGMAFSMSITMGDFPASDSSMPVMLRMFPLFAVIQVGIAVLGFISGINLLKLKAWARNMLEILTWILLIFVVSLGIFMFISMFFMMPGLDTRGFGVMGLIMGVLSIGMYAVPLGIILKYLRGQKVKNAMEKPA